MINTTIDMLLFYIHTLITLVATVIILCINCYIFTTKFSHFLTYLTKKLEIIFLNSVHCMSYILRNRHKIPKEL